VWGQVVEVNAGEEWALAGAAPAAHKSAPGGPPRVLTAGHWSARVAHIVAERTQAPAEHRPGPVDNTPGAEQRRPVTARRPRQDSSRGKADSKTPGIRCRCRSARSLEPTTRAARPRQA